MSLKHIVYKKTGLRSFDGLEIFLNLIHECTLFVDPDTETRPPKIDKQMGRDGSIILILVQGW